MEGSALDPRLTAGRIRAFMAAVTAWRATVMVKGPRAYKFRGVKYLNNERPDGLLVTTDVKMSPKDWEGERRLKAERARLQSEKRAKACTVRDLGGPLARELVRMNRSAETVLRVVGWANGDSDLASQWGKLKARLEQGAIELDVHGAGNGTKGGGSSQGAVDDAPESSGGAGAPPPSVAAERAVPEELATLPVEDVVRLLNDARFLNAHNRKWTVAGLKRRVDRAAKRQDGGGDRLRRLDEALVKARVPGRYIFRVGPLRRAFEGIVQGRAVHDLEFEQLLDVLEKYRAP